MAADRVLNLKMPYEGLTTIANVLAPVGFSEDNNPDDVKVVQNLLRGISLTKNFAGPIGVPQVSGRFDAVTGFWIFAWQSMMSPGGPGVVDGIVSPAQTGGYYGGTPWFIVKLNSLARRANQGAWERFVSELSVSGALFGRASAPGFGIK